VLNLEAVVLLSDRSFLTWQLCHSPPVGNSPQVKNTGLNGLALLHIQRKVNMDLDFAVDEFVKRHNRCLVLH